MRLGVFGGTFDPPHVGHLILADEAYQQLRLNRLLWVLTSNPPHKRVQGITPVQFRIEMLEAAIANNPNFELSRVDIDRPSPHYAVDTVRLLASQYPEACIIYLMGEDSLRDLPLWYKPIEFLQTCSTLGVMRRLADQVDLRSLENQLPGITSKTNYIDAPLIDISASQLRQRIAQGRPYRYFLAPGIYQLIQKHKLYQLA